MSGAGAPPAPGVAMRTGPWRGERDERFGEDLVVAALRAHEDGGPDAEVLKCDARSRVTAVALPGAPVVVKEVLKGGLRRRLADRFRGSPARRAWAAGRRLRALGIGVARPLAFLEQQRLGVPARSLSLARDLREHPTADRLLAGRPDVLLSLADLALALHRAGVCHGDLRAQHVHLDGEREPRLIDLEGIRFRRALSDDERIEDLAQLNASIADALADPAQRRQAFDRYARALPFREPDDTVVARIVARSLAREHLFRGGACGAAEASGSGPTGRP